MKKTKLLGSKLIENINYPRIPNVCMFNNPNDVYDAKFEEGDLLDASSIRYFVDKLNNTNLQNFVKFDYAENRYVKKTDIIEISKPESMTNEDIDEIYNNVIKQ